MVASDFYGSGASLDFFEGTLFFDCLPLVDLLSSVTWDN
jgi:hypothetical protein